MKGGEIMETKTLIKVKIAPLMDEVKIVDIEPNTKTIREAMNLAGVSTTKATDVLLNDEPTDLDTILREDSVVTLLPRVEAGV